MDPAHDNDISKVLNSLHSLKYEVSSWDEGYLSHSRMVVGIEDSGWTACPLVETFKTVIRMYIKTQFVIENSQNDFKI